ncbi:MAG: Asp23/Gls24 family envelope stress response protein [Mogibacterium sp.]|nr:Asp23/Gls24 family envelope stress response protein [Mogibacterium sp.]
MEQDSNLVALTEKIVLGFKEVSRFPKHGRSSRSGEYTHPSIKITEEDGEYTINIDVFVYYGVNIPQLCYDIQTGLIHSLMEHAGVVVRSVNIRVEGVDIVDK